MQTDSMRTRCLATVSVTRCVGDGKLLLYIYIYTHGNDLVRTPYIYICIYAKRSFHFQMQLTEKKLVSAASQKKRQVMRAR